MQCMKLHQRKTVKSEKITAPKASKARSTTTSPTETKRAPSYEEIAIRSYELYLARGGEHGQHEADWLQAESELLAK
jgi:Protein of unknown function (DUF2934)